MYVSFSLNEAPCLLLAHSHLAIRRRLVSGLGCLAEAEVSEAERLASCERGCFLCAHSHLARSVSEYSPSAVHEVHCFNVPPIDAVPARQSAHSVSALGVQVLIMYFPAAQVAQVEQPAAPALLVSPAPQVEHVSAPPVEYDPAWHCSSPCDEGYYSNNEER